MKNVAQRTRERHKPSGYYCRIARGRGLCEVLLALAGRTLRCEADASARIMQVVSFLCWSGALLAQLLVGSPFQGALRG